MVASSFCLPKVQNIIINIAIIADVCQDFVHFSANSSSPLFIFVPKLKVIFTALSHTMLTVCLINAQNKFGRGKKIRRLLYEHNACPILAHS